MFSNGFIRGLELKKKRHNRSLYLDLALLFFELVLDLDLLLCFRLDERDRLCLFDGSDCFFLCGDFEGFLFLTGDDLTLLAEELRYSDALLCGKLVSSVLVRMDWSSTDSKVSKDASLNDKKKNLTQYRFESE